MHDDFSKVAAWLGHARDPRLLVARYRHAVAKDAGNEWFDVLPLDKPKKKAATQSTRAKKLQESPAMGIVDRVSNPAQFI
jgi:hypothetical protein